MLLQRQRTRAQESSSAIEKLYVTMRHMFNRGFYKPGGVSGQSLRKALLTLSPEIYGSITDADKVEMDGLSYVLDRLPIGIRRMPLHTFHFGRRLRIFVRSHNTCPQTPQLFPHRCRPDEHTDNARTVRHIRFALASDVPVQRSGQDNDPRHAFARYIHPRMAQNRGNGQKRTATGR